jgi:hypothetical protein
MIISVPTGLYRSVIPIKESDSVSITFLISNTTPPRSNLLFPKVPIGLINGIKNFPEKDVSKRRKNAGALIFTVSNVAKTERGYGEQRYDIGDILEFNQLTGKTILPMGLDYSTEIRHNITTIDYDSMDVTSEEELVIDDIALTAKELLNNKLNEYKRLRLQTEKIANDNQKLINETTKVIDALGLTINTNTEVNGTTGEFDAIMALINKLKIKRDIAFKTRDKAVVDANEYSVLAKKTLDSLRSISALVK